GEVRMGTLLQYSNGGSSGAGLGIAIVIYVAVFVLYVAAFWRIFTKAGEAGWKAIIPIYNWYIVLKIVGRHEPIAAVDLDGPVRDARDHLARHQFRQSGLAAAVGAGVDLLGLLVDEQPGLLELGVGVDQHPLDV